MKIHIGLLFSFFICLIISCAAMPPEKDFITELWHLNTHDMTIERENDAGEVIVKDIPMLDPSIWIVIKVEHITREWNYESLLIKSCKEWR